MSWLQVGTFEVKCCHLKVLLPLPWRALLVVRWLVAHCPVEVYTECPTPISSQQILEKALTIDGSFYSHKKPHDAMGLVTGPWLRSFGFSSATPADVLGDLRQANYFQQSRNINVHQNILEDLKNKMCSIKQSVCIKVNCWSPTGIGHQMGSRGCLLVYVLEGERKWMGLAGRDRDKEGPIRKTVL